MILMCAAPETHRPGKESLWKSLKDKLVLQTNFLSSSYNLDTDLIPDGYLPVFAELVNKSIFVL